MPVAELTVASDGTVTAAGPVVGASGSAIPLAFASVSFDGTKQSGTSNITTTYDKSSKRYVLTITGVNYDRLSHTAVANKSGYSGAMSFLNVDSLNGKLIVDTRDVNGKLIQDDFTVVVFKAH